MINIFTQHQDTVIKGAYLTGVTNYAFALENFVPLLDKLEIQRRLQVPRFYQRLERDLVKGCVMPHLTLAFVIEDEPTLEKDLERFVNKNIRKAFVLDGIQRINTLRRASHAPDFHADRPLFLNIIICRSVDNLLYRMITLNNGQKPMSARHQIEILAANLLDFGSLPVAVQTEKASTQNRSNNTFYKSDIIKAYIAFLSGIVSIDNQKIIEDKMDELIAEKVLDSDISRDHIEFTAVLDLVRELIDSSYLSSWLKVTNNLIGFAVGIRESFDAVSKTPRPVLEESLRTFDEAFTAINVSKIKLGQVRRKLVSYFFTNFSRVHVLTANDLLMEFTELV